MRNSSDR